MRIFTEQMQELAEWIGKIFLEDLKNAMYYINGFIMAVKQMTKTFVQSREQGESNLGNISDTMYDIEVSTEEATEAVEGLTSSLLGLDQINVLGGGTSSDLGSLDENITNAINKDYSDSMTELQNKAVEISEQILTWLGYTKSVTEETGEVNWNLGEGSTKLNQILEIAKNIATTFASFIVISTVVSIISKILTFVSFISSYSSGIHVIIGKISAALNPVTLIIIALVAAFTYLYITNKEFREDINGIISGLINELAPIIEEIKQTLIEIYKQLKPIIDLVLDFLAVYFPIALEGVVTSIKFIIGLFSNVLNIVKEIIDVITNVGKIVGSVFTFLFGGMTEDEMLEVIKPFQEALKKAIGNIGDEFMNIFKNVGNFFIEMVNIAIRGLNKISFKLPNWLGGYSFGIDIPEIPKLASGGIATTPTLAMIGEYAGAKSNPEIVAPQSIMYDTMVSALSSTMKPLVQAIVQGDNKVISAVNDLSNRPIELNGRKVSEAIYNDLSNVAKRKGKNLGTGV